MNRITTKEQLKDWLDYELSKYPRGRQWYERIFLISEYQVLAKLHVLLRKAEYYHNSGKRIPAAIALIRLRRFQNKYCMRIPLNTCGKGLHFFHQGTVLINHDAVIGEDVSFHFNTAVVNKRTGEGSPVIGNHVMLGIGSVVMGNVSVADHVIVGANAVVTRSILEENVSVAGAPAVIVSRQGTDRRERRHEA